MERTDRPGGKGAGRGRRRRRRRRGNRNRNGANTHALDPNDERLAHSKRARSHNGPEELNPFNLFCAYHLGITRDEGYKFQSVQEVARRFSVDAGVIKESLANFGISVEVLRERGFEAEYAQLDIKVAPEGVSRLELARSMWDELDLPPWVPPPVEEAVETEEAEAAEVVEAEEAEAEEAEAVDAEAVDAEAVEAEAVDAEAVDAEAVDAEAVEAEAVEAEAAE